MLQDPPQTAAEPVSRWGWHPPVWLATGLGLGYSPVAPGTVGGLWGLPLAWGLAHVPDVGPIPAVRCQLVLLVILALVCVPIVTLALRRMGAGKDPGSVVLDEIVSIPIVFLGLSVEQVSSPLVLAVGFGLQRLFDITKPPPVRNLETLPEGLGVMADDTMAGIYGFIAMQLLLWGGLA